VDEAPRLRTVGARKWVGCGEVVSLFLLALKMVSFCALWAVFLQFSCLFTAYANVMPECVTESDKPNE